MPFFCGRHRAFIYERGGVNLIAEIEPLTAVRWQRIRDDVSTAEIRVPTHYCCEILGDLRTVKHELHLYRNDLPVWEGPITRIEYEFEQASIFAADVLWQATRTVLNEGYNQAYPNIGNAIDRMDWLMRDKTFELYGDPWNVATAGHLHPLHHAGDPKTARVVNAWQFYTWEDFDKYAEDYGTDYTVVGRDIYYFDLNLAWKIIPPLDENYLSQFPRIVEYGNQAATRGVVTNGHGYAGVSEFPAPALIDEWGHIDWLVTNESDGQLDNVPTPEEIATWEATAARNINDRVPPPVAIVIPANTTLLPGGPWLIEDLVPGAWFQADVTRLCRSVSEYQRIHEVVVTEQAPDGETVQFSAVSAPASMVMPEDP
jgi:hypothetical protein